MSCAPDFELRHLRTFAAVAQRRSFTRAAEELHIAQQAVSQQIMALERSLGVTLLRRTSQHVELTGEGEVFLADCRRVLAAADRAVQRVQAAARGEAGKLRIAYTLTTVWDMVPALLASMAAACPQVKVEAREVFGADVPELLIGGHYDLALAPMTSYPEAFHRQTVRREPLRIAISSAAPLARCNRIELATLADRLFEIWPREMAPGFHDTIVSTCRTAGFEPRLDEQAGGNMVWGNIARDRGVALINASLAEQLPPGITLIELAEPAPVLTFEAVWHHGEHPLIQRALEAIGQLASEASWL